MKIDSYLEEAEYQELNEFLDPQSLFLIYTVAKVLVVTGKMLAYYSFKDKNKGKYSEDFSSKLSDIVKDECTVHEVIGKSPDIISGKQKIYFTDSLKHLLTEDELLAMLIYHHGEVKYHHGSENLLKVEGFGTAFEVFTAVLGTLFPSVGVITMMFDFLFPDAFKKYVRNKLNKKHIIASSTYVKKFGYTNELVSALNKIEKNIKEQIRKRFNIKNIEKLDKQAEKIQKKENGISIKEKIELIMKSQKVQAIIHSSNFNSIESLYSIVKQSIGEK